MIPDSQKPIEKQSVIPRILNLLGVDEKKFFKAFSIETTQEIVALKYLLSINSDNVAKSPLSLVAKMCDIKDDNIFSQNLRFEIVENFFINVNFYCGDTFVFVLPKHKCSFRLASILAALVSKKLAESNELCDDDDAKSRFLLIEFDPSKAGKHKVSQIDEVSDESRDNFYNAFVTAICTNEELDFQVELELLELRSVSRSNRSRIKERMKELGIKVLRGRKADVYLRQRTTKAKIDLAKLKAEYPEAYKNCYIDAEVGDFISIKLHK